MLWSVQYQRGDRVPVLDTTSSPRAQIESLLCIAKQWLQPERCTATNVIEWLVMDHFFKGSATQRT